MAYGKQQKKQKKPKKMAKKMPKRKLYPKKKRYA